MFLKLFSRIRNAKAHALVHFLGISVEKCNHDLHGLLFVSFRCKTEGKDGLGLLVQAWCVLGGSEQG